jgi:SAM-dependent methyltransferase
MHEILAHLRVGSLVLDLGCAKGSFPQNAAAADVVRVDREPQGNLGALTRFVQADAAQLPFADDTFAAVILNHSLEHFDNLGAALHEIGRVIAPNGSLFVAVPDASSLSDKLHRWLARGGRVNAFTCAADTAAAIAHATGLPHLATRVLCSSLSFLNRRTAPRPLPRRLLALGAGYEWSLFLFTWLSRRRWLNTRTSVYGWGFYFGNVVEPIDTDTWVNVCIRCGSGYSAAHLARLGLVRSRFLRFRTWRCPECHAFNPFADDFSVGHCARPDSSTSA